MPQTAVIRASTLALLVASFTTPAIGATTLVPPAARFDRAHHAGFDSSNPFPALAGVPGSRTAAADAPSSGPARPASVAVPDGSGGLLAVVEALLPDTTVRLVAQKLDASGGRQWLPNGTTVSTSPGVQHDPAVVPDGAGGLIVVWLDGRNSAPGIYAQRIDAAGSRMWGDEGVAVELADPSPGIPRAASDGAGGVIVTWHDARLGQYDIYAQRVDAGGTPLWTADGLRVYSNALDQRDPAIVSDGQGGAILVWEDQRSGLADLYGQRLGPTGVRRWGSAGLAVCTAAGDQRVPALAASDTFCVVAWLDTRAGFGEQVYAQRLDRLGAPGWTPDGVVVCTIDGDRTAPGVVDDGAGGAVLAWAEQRFTPGYVDVYAQRVDASGAALWTADGAEVFANVTLITSAGMPMPVPAIAPDGAGGLFVAYEKWDIVTNLFDIEMMCQRLDATGAPVFTLPGAALSTAPFHSSAPVAMPDGAGGCIALWFDGRATQLDTFAQRIAADGQAHWAADGVPVYLHPGVQVIPQVQPDGAGGTIVAWVQRVGENYDIFARRFDAAGTALWPEVAVCAAPDLQGDLEALADGVGGVFLCWFDMRNGRGQLFVQHLDATGTPSWQPDGVLVKETADYLEGATLILDGAGGVIVPFRQLQQTSVGKYDLWAQHISSAGVATWGAEAMPLTLAASDVPWVPHGIPDGAGGALIAWETWPFGSSSSLLLAQRLDANGQPQWAVNGVLVASRHMRYDGPVPVFAVPEIVTDGGGGAILVWEDARAGTPDSPDLYAQHLTAAGAVTWTAGGMALSTGPGPQYGHRAMADGAGGVIVAWADDRLGAGADLQAQRYDGAGVVQWLGGARTIAAATGVQQGMVIAGDGAGGFIAAWEDDRAAPGEPDIYSQRMDANGNALWTPGGEQVCTAPGLQDHLSIAADAAAGAFVAWADARDGEAYYARLQHVTATGDTTLPRDGVTDVLASIVRAEAAAGRVRLAWQVSDDGLRRDVERRIGDGEWETIASVMADGGLVQLEDEDVAMPGPRGYRLAWGLAGDRVTAGETWLDLSGAGRLAIAAPSPHPVRGPLVLEFTLPRAGTAELDLIDVHGRRAGRQQIAAAAGTHRWAVDPDGRLAAGIYLVRLTQGGASVVRRICLLR